MMRKLVRRYLSVPDFSYKPERLLMRAFLTLIVALLLAACGGSSSTAPTPVTLTGVWQLKSLNGMSMPIPGIASGQLTLRPDSTYTLTVTATDGSAMIPTCLGCTVPLGYVPTGTWRDEGPELAGGTPDGHENLSLLPAFRNAPRWFGQTQNGGIAFQGNNYAALFFVR
jgi:hypothetical protein